MVLGRAFFMAFSMVFCCSTLIAQQPSPAAFKLNDFKKLRFVEGRWVGAGYTKPFYESYRVVNDSTIEMQGHEDATFAPSKQTTTIALRKGRIIMSGEDGGRSVVTKIDKNGVHFAPLARAANTFVWKKESGKQWTAILTANSGKVTRYVMSQVK